MNIRQIVGAASCSLMALSILVQPAFAQAPNLGPDWVVVKERKVRSFVPNPAKPGSGSWQLVDLKNRTYFLKDGELTRKVSTTRKESDEISMGKTACVYGEDQIQKRRKFEVLRGDVPNSRKSYYEGDFLVTYKLTRYALFEDVAGYKPWTIYNRAATRTRDISYFLVEWSDPLTKENFSELDPTPEYSAWVVGDPFNKDIASSGRDNFSRRDSLGNDDRRVILGRTHSPQASLSDLSTQVAKSKVGSYLSNKGAGNTQVALSGSKLRSAMGANSAVASEAKKAQTTGGSIKDVRELPAAAAAAAASRAQSAASQTTPAPTAAPVALIDKIQGAWELKGGSESRITFERAGKSDNVKVGVKLSISRAADFSHEFTTQFAKSLSASKSGRTVSMQFNDDGSQLSIQLGLVKATFVKVSGQEKDRDRDD